MTPSSILLTLLFLVLVLVDGATIEQTCRSAAIGQQGFNYQLCVDGLKSDPISPGTDVELQAYAAAHQALVRAEAAWNKAATLPRRDGSIAPLLDQCTSLYNDLRGTVQTALNLLQNEQKLLGRRAAIQELVGARDGANQCPNAFAKAGKPSPLVQESRDAADSLVIAVAVLGLLPN